MSLMCINYLKKYFPKLFFNICCIMEFFLFLDLSWIRNGVYYSERTYVCMCVSYFIDHMLPPTSDPLNHCQFFFVLWIMTIFKDIKLFVWKWVFVNHRLDWITPRYWWGQIAVNFLLVKDVHLQDDVIHPWGGKLKPARIKCCNPSNKKFKQTNISKYSSKEQTWTHQRN